MKTAAQMFASLLYILLCPVTLSCTHHPRTATPLKTTTSSLNVSTNIITVGANYDDTVRLIKKHKGIDITAGLALMPLGDKPPLTVAYWQFLDYDSILGVIVQDKKITSMTYWTKEDFGHSKAHRAKTEQNITCLKFNTATKEVSVDKTIVPPVPPLTYKRTTNRTNITTTNTVSPEFLAQQEKAMEQMLAETTRNFELANQADVEITYSGPTRISLRKPGDTKSLTVTEKTLIPSVANMTFKRDLAVVLLGHFITSSDPRMRNKVDELEALLQAQGFKRVVFHQNTAFGRFTYRE